MKSIKAFFTVILSLAALSPCIAQFLDTARVDYVRPQTVQPLATSNNSLSFGLGVGGYYPYYGVYYAASPNIALMFDHTIFKNIGLGNISFGTLVSYKQISSSYMDYSTGYNYIQNWNYYVLGARVIYSIPDFPTKTIEPYAGAMLGYYITSFKFRSNDPDYSEPSDPGYYLTPNNYPDFFAPGIFAGIRSYFSNHGNVWIEAGYGYTTVAFGLSYKL